MRYVEFVEITRSVLEALRRNDVRLDDVRNVEMFHEYERLKGEGHKIEYVYAYLAEVYGYSPRHVRRICDRMGSTLQ